MSNNANLIPSTSLDENIVVVSGPSGSGKTTLITRLMKDHPELIFSTSHTTRSIRSGEKDGVDYHFVSVDLFRQMISQNAFVEWADVYGNFYGTSYMEIERKLSPKPLNPENAEESLPGKTPVLLLDIDVQGAKNIKKKYPGALFIMITPPSLDELRSRLLAREQKIDSHIENRLRIAKDELSCFELYRYIVVNDNIETAYAVLNAIYTASRNTVYHYTPFMKRLLNN